MSQEKQREIDDLHQLEHGMQQAARGMQNTQPDAAKKLRDAIGELQQNELESRMRWTVDALNKGIGSYAVMREAPVTQALNQLKESLQSTEGVMKGSGQSGDPQEGMRQALDRAESSIATSKPWPRASNPAATSKAHRNKAPKPANATAHPPAAASDRLEAAPGMQ